MAGFREHVTVSGACGAAYGGGMFLLTPIEPAQACVAGTLCGVAGMLPDLDSDSGRPIREIVPLLAAAVPFVLVRRFAAWTGSYDGVVFLGLLTYALVRYGGGKLLRRLTVHRGMFHSVPAMLAAGLLTFLAYKAPHLGSRLLMGTGVMVGFASHLLLDEWYSVDLRRLRLKKSAGTAVKWAGPDPAANLACWGLMLLAGYLAAAEADVIELGPTGLPRKIEHAPRVAELPPAPRF